MRESGRSGTMGGFKMIFVLALAIASLAAPGASAFRFGRCFLPADAPPSELIPKGEIVYMDVTPIGADPLYVRQERLPIKEKTGARRTTADVHISYLSHGHLKWFRFDVIGHHPSADRNGMYGVGAGMYQTFAEAQAARASLTSVNQLPNFREWRFPKDDTRQFYGIEHFEVTRCCNTEVYIVVATQSRIGPLVDPLPIAVSKIQKVTLRCPDQDVEGLLWGNFKFLPWPEFFPPTDAEAVETVQDTIFFGRPNTGGDRQGEVVVFRQGAPNDYTFRQTLRAVPQNNNGRFGASISASGDNLVVSEDFCDHECSPGDGKCRAVRCGAARATYVHIFVRKANNMYQHLRRLRAGNHAGFPVTLSRFSLTVGNPAGTYRSYSRPSSKWGRQYPVLKYDQIAGQANDLAFNSKFGAGHQPGTSDQGWVALKRNRSQIAIFQRRLTGSGPKLVFHQIISNPNENKYQSSPRATEVGVFYKEFVNYSFGSAITISGRTLMADSQGTPKSFDRSRNFRDQTSSDLPGRSGIQIYFQSTTTNQFVHQGELTRDFYPGLPIRLGRSLKLSSPSSGHVMCYSSDIDPMFVAGYSIIKEGGRWKFEHRLIINEKPEVFFLQNKQMASLGNRLVITHSRTLDFTPGSVVDVPPTLYIKPAP